MGHEPGTLNFINTFDYIVSVFFDKQVFKIKLGARIKHSVFLISIKIKAKKEPTKKIMDIE